MIVTTSNGHPQSRITSSSQHYHNDFGGNLLSRYRLVRLMTWTPTKGMLSMLYDDLHPIIHHNYNTPSQPMMPLPYLMFGDIPYHTLGPIPTTHSHFPPRVNPTQYINSRPAFVFALGMKTIELQGSITHTPMLSNTSLYESADPCGDGGFESLEGVRWYLYV